MMYMIFIMYVHEVNVHIHVDAVLRACRMYMTVVHLYVHVRMYAVCMTYTMYIMYKMYMMYIHKVHDEKD